MPLEISAAASQAAATAATASKERAPGGPAAAKQKVKPSIPKWDKVQEERIFTGRCPY